MCTDKFESADLKYHNSFSKFWSKSTKIRHFWSESFLFYMKLCILSNSEMLISNMTIFFQILTKKYQNKAFLVPNFFFIITKLCKLKIFEVVDFKYDNCFSKFWRKNTQIRRFLDPNAKFFGLQETLHLANSKVLISIFFKFFPKFT